MVDLLQKIHLRIRIRFTDTSVNFLERITQQRKIMMPFHALVEKHILKNAKHLIQEKTDLIIML